MILPDSFDYIVVDEDKPADICFYSVQLEDESLLREDEINVFFSIENFEYWGANHPRKIYKHYNKFGAYGNKKKNIYISSNHSSIQYTEDYKIIPTIFCRIAYYNKVKTYWKQRFHVPFAEKKFILFTSQNQANNNKSILYNKLKTLGEIHYITQYPHLRNVSCYHSQELLEVYSQYKFIVSFENSHSDGYITEKIFNALMSQTIPIYDGAPNISTFINPKRFIRFDENIMKKVSVLMNNEILYNHIVSYEDINPEFQNISIDYDNDPRDNINIELMNTRMYKWQQNIPSGLAKFMDVVLLNSNCTIYNKPLDEANTIFINTRHHFFLIHKFIDTILPKLTKNVNIIIAGEDFTCPGCTDERYPSSPVHEINKFIHMTHHKFVNKVFVENLDQDIDNVVPIPLGINEDECSVQLNYFKSFENIDENKEMKVTNFNRVRSEKQNIGQWSERARVKLLCETQWNNYIATVSNHKHTQYLQHLRKYMFTLCVHGGGLDVNPKLWEALLVGVIPIIRETKPYTDIYVNLDLPVVIVDGWDTDTINEENLIIWRDKYYKYFTNTEERSRILKILSLKFWVDYVSTMTNNEDINPQFPNISLDYDNAIRAGDYTSSLICEDYFTERVLDNGGLVITRKHINHNNISFDKVKYVCLTGYDSILLHFFENLLDKFESPVTVIIIESDVVNIRDTWLKHTKLKRCFLWNKPFVHPKLTCLPIGLNYSRHYKSLSRWLSISKIDVMNESGHHWLAVNYSPNTNSVRGKLVEKARTKWSEFCHVLDFIQPIQSYWKESKIEGKIKVDVSDPKCYDVLQKYKFILCPPGAGEDTHRTWETLYLGCIPIVQSSPLDELYADLPVAVINNWDEISISFLEHEYKRISLNKKLKKYDMSKIMMEYWYKRIFNDS
jgi:hypothetical protein